MKLLDLIRYWLGIVPSWKKCRHASCWAGKNAARRMMNIMSPYFTDSKFKEYVKWMSDRGCDTAHFFLINTKDGEGAGYNCATESAHAKLAVKRIEYLRKKGFAIVPWIIADDSATAAKDLFAHADDRVKALSSAGLFKYASYVVLGLEMNEYGSSSDWTKVADALRKVWKGKTGVHHTSGNSFPFVGLADIVLGQLEPSAATVPAIEKQIAAIRAKGKAAVGFEYARSPDRRLAQAALDAGAVGCGNW